MLRVLELFERSPEASLPSYLLLTKLEVLASFLKRVQYFMRKSRKFSTSRSFLLFNKSKQRMENALDQGKEEVNVDFGEDAPQNEPELSLESLDKLAENIDAEQNDDLQKVKEMAAEVILYYNWLWLE